MCYTLALVEDFVVVIAKAVVTINYDSTAIRLQFDCAASSGGSIWGARGAGAPHVQSLTPQRPPPPPTKYSNACEPVYEMSNVQTSANDSRYFRCSMCTCLW